jgi:hypothetical protein
MDAAAPVPQASAIPELSEEQLNALKLLLSNHVAVLVGPPGSGKTTLLRKLVEMERAAGRVVAIQAPTAAASSAARLVVQRLAACTTIDKFTLSSSSHNAYRRYRGATIIVDETSMASPLQFVHLLRTLRCDGDEEPCIGRLIAVGDDDQLRPVCAARILAELIQYYPTARLTTVYRQNAGTALYRNILKIKTTQVRMADLEEDESFKLVHVSEAGDYEWLRPYIDPAQPLPFTLCLTNEVCNAASVVVQDAYNPDGYEVIGMQHAGRGAKTGLRLNDFVVCQQNYYRPASSDEAKQLARAGEIAASIAREAGAHIAGDEDAEDERTEDEEEETFDDGGDKRDVLIVANGCPGRLCMEQGALCVRYDTISLNGFQVPFHDEMDGQRDPRNPFGTKFSQGYTRSVHKGQGRQAKVVLGIALTKNRRPQPGMLYTMISRAQEKCVLFTNDTSLLALTQRVAEPRSALSHAFVCVRREREQEALHAHSDMDDDDDEDELSSTDEHLAVDARKLHQARTASKTPEPESEEDEWESAAPRRKAHAVSSNSEDEDWKPETSMKRERVVSSDEESLCETRDKRSKIAESDDEL